jgi:hypothetical protein
MSKVGSGDEWYDNERGVFELNTVYEVGLGRAYGGSGPDEEEEAEASRDSRVAWASTQGNRGVDEEYRIPRRRDVSRGKRNMALSKRVTKV